MIIPLLNAIDATNYDPCSVIRFPGGEPQVKWNLSYLENETFVTLQMQRFDFPLLAVAVDGIRRARPDMDINLFLPYFPGARQDRVCQEGEALSAKVYADMINSLGFARVTVLDPHSNVAPALINNVKVIKHGIIPGNGPKSAEFLFHWVDHVSATYGSRTGWVVAPDAGASAKVLAAVHAAAPFCPTFEFRFSQGFKKRNVTDGSLSGFDSDTRDYEELPVLIMDDINCNGGTFIGLADVIRSKDAGSVDLFTTHLDHFMGAMNVIKDVAVDRYFTTNSNGPWNEGSPASNIEVFDIFYPAGSI